MNDLENLNPETTYLVSDTHWGHHNILSYQNRPFKDVTHMNEAMINNWNSKVGTDGIVIHVGDMFMGNPINWERIFKRLNGKIYSVFGNHDRKKRLLDMGVLETFHQLHIKVDGLRYWLSHYPVGSKERPVTKEEYDFAICGHVHGAWKRQDKCINVSVEMWNYTPISFIELENYLQAEGLLEC